MLFRKESLNELYSSRGIHERNKNFLIKFVSIKGDAVPVTRVRAGEPENVGSGMYNGRDFLFTRQSSDQL
jgi:hypothetical protein